ncbi:Vps53-like protein [Cantharellus anzutake]|uniref:Vps53-like protein n=1 Tax=Cantharellus anzutake TaxID=1750568 RepID=UPI001908FEB6|nr:Vps53-like protein [Cantharellus anzutake]KAF8310331.1 Vps53-like protein [Cantharellus anzutake]
MFSDPLDSFDFTENHAVNILNNLIPDEASLTNLDSVQRKLRDDQRSLQQEIVILRNELHKDQNPERMQVIQELISELLSQMARIREKATESEAVVREITKDIQVLDLAKKNILHSITALKRFQMLVNALAQLEGQIRGKNYGQISQTLSAVKEFSAIFKTYTAVERVAAVWKKVQEMQAVIGSMIDEDFNAFFFHDNIKAPKPAILSDACLVVDVLGHDVRDHLIDRYCSIELKEYRRVFRANDEAGQIDNISRRFAWFRRILMNHYDEEGYAEIFPPEWQVGEHLCARFVDITRFDSPSFRGPATNLTRSLIQGRCDSGIVKECSFLTVTMLLDALKQTLEFEQSMAKRFGMPFSKIIQYCSNREPKAISSAFDPHMGVFVDAQEKLVLMSRPGTVFFRIMN